MAGTNPGKFSFDIGGKKILGLTIPKIRIGSKIKEALKSPGQEIQDEVSKTVGRGVLKPILIGAGIIAAAILTVAALNHGGGSKS